MSGYIRTGTIYSICPVSIRARSVRDFAERFGVAASPRWQLAIAYSGNARTRAIPVHSSAIQYASPATPVCRLRYTINIKPGNNGTHCVFQCTILRSLPHSLATNDFHSRALSLLLWNTTSLYLMRHLRSII